MKYLSKLQQQAFLAIALGWPTLLFAEPAKKPTADDLFGTLEGNVIRGGKLLLVAVSAIAFIWIAYSAVAKFRECQSGRADWGELVVLVVGAGALLLFIFFLLASAGGILTSSAT